MTGESRSLLPFRVVIEPTRDEVPLNPDVALESTAGDAWSLDDLEAAYQQALDSLESLDEVVADAVAVDANGSPEPAPEVQPLPPGTPEAIEPVPFFPNQPTARSAPTVNQRQVIEALLFVGGSPLSTRKLADLLGGSATPEDVLSLIDELNARYATDERPYRIQIAEGGCRMQLNPEFEKVRHRVYGVGPREVKLSQDVLEILAYIAYSQPASDERLAGLGRESTPTAVRQLLRRELIEIRRDQAGVIHYATTPRFLELFGLGGIDDLPLPSDLAFK